MNLCKEKVKKNVEIHTVWQCNYTPNSYSKNGAILSLSLEGFLLNSTTPHTTQDGGVLKPDVHSKNNTSEKNGED